MIWLVRLDAVVLVAAGAGADAGAARSARGEAGRLAISGAMISALA